MNKRKNTMDQKGYAGIVASAVRSIEEVLPVVDAHIISALVVTLILRGANSAPVLKIK
jgi:hypothetical protein